VAYVDSPPKLCGTLAPPEHGQGLVRVVHFGSGGGKGVTRVMVDLAAGHVRSGRYQPIVIFRRKRGPVADHFRKDLQRVGIRCHEVRRAPRRRVIAELRAIVREHRPDVFVAHGYSEHLWGRLAAIKESVPLVVQVEHNHERYKWGHLRQSLRLDERTDAVVTVSDSIGMRLREYGFPPAKIRTIYNGVRVERYAGQGTGFDARVPDVLMISRFGRQKDQATLIRAAALLRDRGRPVRVRLVGGGKWLPRRRAERLVDDLRLRDQVEFLGHRSDVPDLLQRSRVFVLSTHFEGLPLALIEALAAGCACIGTRVPGVEELIEHGRTGWLVEHENPESLADAITAALGPAGAVCASAGQVAAEARFNFESMTSDYERLFDELLLSRGSAAPRSVIDSPSA
jgi:glycosyltransferase involved in cell wall biosynthesis